MHEPFSPDRLYMRNDSRPFWSLEDVTHYLIELAFHASTAQVTRHGLPPFISGTYVYPKLLDGSLRATGLINEVRRPIATYDWIDLKPVDFIEGGIAVDHNDYETFTDGLANGAIWRLPVDRVWRGVHVPSDQARALWTDEYGSYLREHLWCLMSPQLLKTYGLIFEKTPWPPSDDRYQVTRSSWIKGRFKFSVELEVLPSDKVSFPPSTSSTDSRSWRKLRWDQSTCNGSDHSSAHDRQSVQELPVLPVLELKKLLDGLHQELSKVPSIKVAYQYLRKKSKGVTQRDVTALLESHFGKQKPGPR